MDILILGNGFDLAHGLKTQYSDFLDYCRTKINEHFSYEKMDSFFTNMWVRHFLNIQMGNTWIDLETEIYNVVKHIAKLPVINTQNYYGQFSVDFNNFDFNFYDFDKYLGGAICSINTGTRGYSRFNENDYFKYYVYFENSRGIINFLYHQLLEFTILFENYLLDKVLTPLGKISKYQLSLKSIGVNKGSNAVHVLSFNYTDTCERLYNKKFNTYCNINIKPVYVHGKAEKGKSNLVLGTHSFYNYLPNPINEQIPIDFNVFKKHHQRHKFGTIEPYQDLLRQIKKSKSIPKFHIIGHSLDRTDHNILNHILLANNDAKINIYYHNEETQQRLMNKIDSIIGEEEVMSKVRFIHQHDKERGILIPKND